MITPAATDQSSFYKIGDWVSFAWNYTSLSVTPKAINVLASCSKNQETYTLATNMSVEKTGMVYWDTGEYQKTATKSLIMETYTLVIYDADSSVSATAAPGYLSVADTFYFGMYLPQPYTPRSGKSSRPDETPSPAHQPLLSTILQGPRNNCVWFRTHLH